MKLDLIRFFVETPDAHSGSREQKEIETSNAIGFRYRRAEVS